MTDQPAPECPDACTERHTYSPDCAATRDDYDPNAGMRERYAAALYAHHYGCPPNGDTWRGTRDDYLHTADAVLAARDVYLNNVRRISREQTTQLAELYMATKKQAEKSEQQAARFSSRLGHAREWARRNLPADQADRLAAVLRGDVPRRDSSDELQPPEETRPVVFPDIQGRCPACRGESLFLADGGYVTCRRLDCPAPPAQGVAVTCRIWAELVAEYLSLAGHDGHRTRQDSTRTVRVSHPGTDEAQQLELYAQTLRNHGYTVTPEKATGIRPNRLRVTRASADYPMPPDLND